MAEVVVSLFFPLMELVLWEGRVMAAGLEEVVVAEGFLVAMVVEEAWEEDVPGTVVEEEEG